MAARGKMTMGSRLGFSRNIRYASEYKKCRLRDRWLWLYRKGNVVSMSEGLVRTEVGSDGVRGGVYGGGGYWRDVESMFDIVKAMEEWLNRVVGIRRVD